MDFLSEVFGISVKMTGYVLAGIGLVILLTVVVVVLAFDLIFNFIDGGSR